MGAAVEAAIAGAGIFAYGAVLLVIGILIGLTWAKVRDDGDRRRRDARRLLEELEGRTGHPAENGVSVEEQLRRIHEAQRSMRGVVYGPRVQDPEEPRE